MTTLRDRMIGEIETLAPAELIAVQGMIDALKRAAPTQKHTVGTGRQRARVALLTLTGSMADTLLLEREEERL
jgi:hypothetical protein